jgi:uncharacterized protein
MWRRLGTARLQALAAEHPVVLVLGARQVGKTTLARAALRRFGYADLTDAQTLARFRASPARAIAEAANPALVIDDVHALPEVFSALASIVAKAGAHARFVLLASAQPALGRSVTRALAGRMGVLDLDPLTAVEVARGKDRRPFADVWLRGGFPAALAAPDFHAWWEAYLHDYVERDLPALGVRAEPGLLRRLLATVAHNQGGILDVAQLRASLGVSLATVEQHLQALEQTQLLRRLPALRADPRDRAPAAPKVYLRDSGLLHHLLDLTIREKLASHPIASVSWETFVLEDLARRERLAHPGSRLFYFRTKTGAEVDVVIERGGERFPIEIRSARAAKPEAVDALEAAAQALGARRAYFIDQGKGREQLRAGIERMGFGAALDWLPE